MKETSRSKAWLMALGTLALLAAAAAVLLVPSPSPRPNQQASAERTTRAEGSELLQTLTYTRCEHTVTRRLTAPVELYGKTMEETAALYPEWRITEFSAVMVRMERQPDMFCPDHMVLMPNGAGYLCVFENRYGDALALVRELELEVKNLPSAAQEEVEEGIGFSTAAEMEQWLESVES